MLVKFDSKVGSFIMFGDVAVPLLKLMGMSGDLPGAVLAADIPAALAKLKGGATSADPHGATSDDGGNVTLRKRAVPLIDLLERSAAKKADVTWDVSR
jgi:hypothetical protein